jgi:hypothetical protein
MFGPRRLRERWVTSVAPVVHRKITAGASTPRDRLNLLFSHQTMSSRLRPPNLGQPAPNRAAEHRSHAHHDKPDAPVVVAGRQVPDADAQQQEEQEYDSSQVRHCAGTLSAFHVKSSLRPARATRSWVVLEVGVRIANGRAGLAVGISRSPSGSMNRRPRPVARGPSTSAGDTPTYSPPRAASPHRRQLDLRPAHHDALAFDDVLASAATAGSNRRAVDADRLGQ